jgi:hypothetical protein
MKNTIAELKAQILAFGLREVDALTQDRVSRFVAIDKFIGDAQQVPLTFTTYRTGYVRRNIMSYHGPENAQLNKLTKPTTGYMGGKQVILLWTEEERLERLLDYLKHCKFFKTK